MRDRLYGGKESHSMIEVETVEAAAIIKFIRLKLPKIFKYLLNT